MSRPSDPTARRGLIPALRSPKILLVSSVLCCIALLAAGTAKLAQLDFELEAFRSFGIPVWLMIQVGCVEILAALLLPFLRTATLGAILGTAVMVVAIPAHFAAGEGLKAFFPAGFLAVLTHVGWHRREGLRSILGEAKTAPAGASPDLA